MHLLYTQKGRGAITYYSAMAYQSLSGDNMLIVPTFLVNIREHANYS